MWIKGSFAVDGICFSYEAKVFDEGSQFGINGGRISKLNVRTTFTVNTVMQYDRGWIVRPKTVFEEKALDYILNLYK